MKVIHSGVLDPSWSAELKCVGRSYHYGCGAELLVERGDLFRYPTFGGVFGKVDCDQAAFVCSECGETNDVDGLSEQFVAHLPYKNE